jgi:hypothetical protein
LTTNGYTLTLSTFSRRHEGKESDCDGNVRHARGGKPMEKLFSILAAADRLLVPKRIAKYAPATVVAFVAILTMSALGLSARAQTGVPQ